MKKGEAIVIGIVFSVLPWIFGFCVGVSKCREVTFDEAARAGAGVYITDGKSSEAKFHWIVP